MHTKWRFILWARETICMAYIMTMRLPNLEEIDQKLKELIVFLDKPNITIEDELKSISNVFEHVLELISTISVEQLTKMFPEDQRAAILKGNLTEEQYKAVEQETGLTKEQIDDFIRDTNVPTKGS